MDELRNGDHPEVSVAAEQDILSGRLQVGCTIVMGVYFALDYERPSIAQAGQEQLKSRRTASNPIFYGVDADAARWDIVYDEQVCPSSCHQHACRRRVCQACVRSMIVAQCSSRDLLARTARSTCTRAGTLACVKVLLCGASSRQQSMHVL